MAYAYIGTNVNPCPVVTATMGADLNSGAYKAVKIVDGKAVVTSTAGEQALGVLVAGTASLKVDDSATVQIYANGKGIISGTVAYGDALAVAADGNLAKAVAGNYIFGYALEDMTDGICTIQIAKGGKF